MISNLAKKKKQDDVVRLEQINQRLSYARIFLTRVISL